MAPPSGKNWAVAPYSSQKGKVEEEKEKEKEEKEEEKEEEEMSDI